MANRRFIDFPIASTSGDTDIILIWQDGANKQTTKATFLSGLPENLDELNDVAISGLTNGQILRYDSVTGKWENTDQGNLDLNDLNDVSIVSPSNGQVLVYNSSTSQWENSSGGYVPYVGAVTTVDLGAQQLKAGYTTLTTNGSTETLTINHTSGSGKAINVTKGGAGEGLYVNKTSGSGNAATIVGTLEATTLNKTAGTSTQFLKADGSVDSTTYQNTADKGQPNGYASLDGNGKVPLTQINDALIGNVNFQGLWNASTNTPTLVDPPSSGTKGYYYIVSTGGTFAGITFEVGDWIISNGTAWGKVDNTDAVSSVFGRTGNVTAINGDYNTSQVTESGNLYYTDARSRAALSFAAGSGTYNSGTGVITIPTNNNQITNGAGYITSAALSGYVQGSGTTNYLPKFTGSTTIGNSNISDDGSGIIVTGGTSMTGGWNRNTILEATYPVLVYNSNGSKWAGIGYDYNAGLRIWVNASSSDATLGANNVLFIDNSGAATFSSSVTANSFIKSGGTSTQFLKADGSVDSTSYGTGTVTSVGLSSATSGVTIGSSPVTTSGTITLAIATASGSQNGLLSSTDWTTFNNKQNALTNPVTGTGTTNYLPKFTGSTTIGNSNISDDGSGIIVTGGTSMTGGWNRNTILEATYPVLVYNSNGSKWAGIGYDYNAGLRIWVNASSSDATLGANNVLFIDNSGAATFSSSVTANSFIKSGGTSSQFLKADGSVDSTSYGTGTVTSVGLSSATSGVTIGSSPVTTSGTITLAIATASGSQNGLLSSTDWTTFNNKQNALTNPVTGTGTTNYLPKFTGSTTIGNSNISDDGSGIIVTGGTSMSGGWNRNTILEATYPVLVYNSNGSKWAGIGYDYSGALRIWVNASSQNATTGLNAFSINNNGTAQFSSSVTATSFFESSDASLKTLVEDNYQAKGIDSVVAKLYIKNGKEELGYYAQDLQEVLPSAVSKGSDGLLNLSYREVHTAKIAYLEEKIKQLENELGRISK
jgi:hypothetical protein